MLRTFSKIYGLCGLRVGYGLCARRGREAVDKVRQPFNVNRLAQVAALEALKHQDQVAQRRETNARLRDLLVARLAERGRATVPSEANFMLVDMSDLCDPAGQGLRRAALHGRDRARRQRAGLSGLGARERGYEAEIEFFLDKLAALEVGGQGAAKGRTS